MIKATCVILNYNDWKRSIDLASTIISYDSIDYVIVVDNCSTDNSREKLNIHLDEKYIFIESDRNGGYGYGNNLGIKRARELGVEYILIANPDVVFTNECLKHMLSQIVQIKLCGAIGAKETYLGTYGWKYTSGLDDVLSASIIFNKLLRKRYYPRGYFENKEYAKVDVIPGCFVLISAVALEESKIYDEDFFLYEEEKVVYEKLKRKGLISVIDLDTSFEHRHIRPTYVDIKKLLITKKRLLKSKALFLRKYRNFNTLQMAISKLFFALCLLEMWIYGVMGKIRGRI